MLLGGGLALQNFRRQIVLKNIGEVGLKPIGRMNKWYIYLHLRCFFLGIGKDSMGQILRSDSFKQNV